MKTVCVILLMNLGLGTLSLRSADWSQWRGPDANGISKESLEGISGLEEVWKAEAGLGFSGFVVANGRVFTMGHDGKETDTVWCFDAESGKVIWKHSYPQPLGDLYYPGGSTGTPTVDGEVVYSLARAGELFCFEAASGKVKWKKQLRDDFGYDMPAWGFTGSPKVYGSLLLLNAGDAGLALRKEDGSEVWKSKNGEASYSAPYLVHRDGTDLVIFSNKRGYTCVESKNGKEWWRVKWLTRYGVNAADPVTDGEHIFISSGYDKGATLVKWDGQGKPKTVWKNREMKSQMNACVLIDGFLYGVSGNEGQDGTGLKCLELVSGESKWVDTSVGQGAVAATEGGRLIVLSESGELMIGKASPEGFKPTVKKKVMGGKCWTAPVLANGKIYCRNGNGQVVCVKVKS
ncbi:MAG: PQQ-binding-like beta-propeller repeat protein [Verrucomicrobia bacterium]|nr:PQQ-binding-like beta-propeller repeat protein [Verrucomicrobiota bacterium]